MLTQSTLKEYLIYDPSTGLFEWIKYAGNRARIGTIAGSLNETGYIYIKLLQKPYKAHRLAFLYMTGSFPKGLVDHINGIKIDNSWANLREATKAENAMNARMHRDNKTGYKGVYFRKDTGKYQASIRVDGKKLSLGSFVTAEEARDAYVDAARKHAGAFARV